MKIGGILFSYVMVKYLELRVEIQCGILEVGKGGTPAHRRTIVKLNLGD